MEDVRKTNTAAARKSRVDERRIREWRQKKSDLMKIPSKKKRLEGQRKAALPEMEEVVAWIEGCRAKNLRVTRASVHRKAANLAQAQGKGLPKTLPKTLPQAICDHLWENSPYEIFCES